MRKTHHNFPFRTNRNIQHTTYHTRHELIRTTYKTNQTSQNMMLNKLTKIPLKRGHEKKDQNFPCQTKRNIQHAIYHTRHELIRTTYKTKQTSQNMMLNKVTKIPLKRGHEKTGHNSPLRNQQKRTAYNVPRST